ncbi:MAG: polyhydroxyalkanoate synthase, partial [Actinomycetota bacterium]
MASVNDVTRPDGDIPPLRTDYTGVKSGCMGITSKR